MKTRTITQTEVTQKQVDETLDLLRSKVEVALKKHGRFPFFSTKEIYGKLMEESYETLRELHAKDKEKFYEELLDVAIVAVFGHAGRNNTKPPRVKKSR